MLTLQPPNNIEQWPESTLLLGPVYPEAAITSGPEVAITGEPEPAESAQTEDPGSVTEPETAGPAQPAQKEEPDSVTEPETAEPILSEHTGSPAGTDQAVRR